MFCDREVDDDVIGEFLLGHITASGSDDNDDDDENVNCTYLPVQCPSFD